MQQYDTVTINIPAGIYDGAELRIAGKGDAGIFGGEYGDLFLKISVTPHKQFKRVDDDLESDSYADVSTIWYLGARWISKHLDGEKRDH